MNAVEALTRLPNETHVLECGLVRNGCRIEPKSRKAVPYYEQVANVLRTNIVGGDDRKPVRLPPERDLCDIHRVSRITVRRALELLEREGLVQRTRGRGTLTIPDAIRQWKHLRQSRGIPIRLAVPSRLDRGRTVRPLAPDPHP
jgi:DNA-binding transcriptional regulator YhcF (GntR family)